MNIDLPNAGIFIGIIWLIVLSFFVWLMHSRYNSAFKDSEERTIMAVLSRLVKENELIKKEIVLLLGRMNTLEEKTLSHIQKIGLIRFNPFQDTGGEQSFILALLDKHNSGVVISGLYARSGMRWYIKKVLKGKGVDHELSDEERKAVETAK